MDVIDRFRGEYWFLSNFYPCEIFYEGDVYPSVEHAYQAAKTEDSEERSKIRNARTPGEAKRLGKSVTLREDWEERKLAVMSFLVWQKFVKNPYLCALLLDTGFTTLVEGNSWGDTFWGKCRGEGKNWLGVILMLVRSSLMMFGEAHA